MLKSSPFGSLFRRFSDLVISIIEILECVLGKALVFVFVSQRDRGHTLRPVSSVDQFVEFCQSVFEVIEVAHALRYLLPLSDGNFQRHGSIHEAIKDYPCAVV